jgi:hypothetical protein
MSASKRHAAAPPVGDGTVTEMGARASEGEVTKPLILTDLPAELVAIIASFLFLVNRVRLAATCRTLSVAVYSATSLWRSITPSAGFYTLFLPSAIPQQWHHKRLSDSSLHSCSPFAARLTDAALHVLLTRCRAAVVTKELSLYGCLHVTGMGLAPLAGKEATQHSYCTPSHAVHAVAHMPMQCPPFTASMATPHPVHHTPRTLPYLVAHTQLKLGHM